MSAPEEPHHSSRCGDHGLSAPAAPPPPLHAARTSSATAASAAAAASSSPSPPASSPVSSARIPEAAAYTSRLARRQPCARDICEAGVSPRPSLRSALVEATGCTDHRDAGAPAAKDPLRSAIRASSSPARVSNAQPSVIGGWPGAISNSATRSRPECVARRKSRQSHGPACTRLGSLGRCHGSSRGGALTSRPGAPMFMPSLASARMSEAVLAAAKGLPSTCAVTRGTTGFPPRGPGLVTTSMVPENGSAADDPQQKRLKGRWRSFRENGTLRAQARSWDDARKGPGKQGSKCLAGGRPINDSEAHVCTRGGKGLLADALTDHDAFRRNPGAHDVDVLCARPCGRSATNVDQPRQCQRRRRPAQLQIASTPR